MAITLMVDVVWSAILMVSTHLRNACKYMDYDSFSLTKKG